MPTRLGGETGAGLGLAVAALISIALTARIWPVFSVPFFFKGRYRWSGAAHGYLWHGPGLGRSWRITRLPLARWKLTPAFWIPLLGLMLPLLALRLLLGRSFVLSLVFYAVVLPYLSMLNLDLTASLLAEEERRKEPV